MSRYSKIVAVFADGMIAQIADEDLDVVAEADCTILRTDLDSGEIYFYDAPDGGTEKPLWLPVSDF